MNREGELRVSTGQLIGFSLGSLGTGIFSITPSVLLLYFMTDVLGIAAGLAALALAVPRFWDIVMDPLVGALSDRTQSRWGRRQPYLFVGAIMMSCSFVFLFSVPDGLSTLERFWYVLAIFVVSSTAYSIFAVPYVTMPAEMSDSPEERTRIMAYRIGFALAGLLIGATVAPLLVEWFGGGRRGYAMMSYLVGGFCALTMLAAFLTSRNIRLSERPGHSPPLREQLRTALRNRQFFVLLATYIVQISGISAFMAAVPYYIIHIHRGTAGGAGVVFLALMSMALLAIPLWSALAIRWGKWLCYIAATSLYAAISIAFVLLPQTAHPQAPLVLAAALGVPFGCIMMVPFSMLTDTIQLDSLATGLRREGIFTGVWMAGEKAGLAIGPLIVGSILGVSGFVPSTDGAIVLQPENAQLGIKAAFAIVPAVVVLSSLLLLRFYRIRESMLTQLLVEKS